MDSPFLCLHTHTARQGPEGGGMTRAQGPLPSLHRSCSAGLLSLTCRPGLPLLVSRGARLFSLLGTFLDFKNK